MVGEIVKQWTEFGHVFAIEKLPEPVQRGATLRHYRLWDNGHPATGWQWHATQEDAESAAAYLLRGSYVSRIEYLEQRVHELECRAVR